MIPGIILTSNYPVNFWWWKEKDKFIEKFMASQSLLDYFAIQKLIFYCHNRFVYLFSVVYNATIVWWIKIFIYVGEPSAVGQPTKPTQPFILSGSINE